MSTDLPVWPHGRSWWRVLRTFAPPLWPQRLTLAAALACTLGATLALLALPWPLKYLIDLVLVGQAGPGWYAALLGGWSPGVQVLALATAALAIAGAAALCSAAEKMLNARLREGLARDLRDRLLAHVQSLPVTLRTQERTGELVLRLVDDVHHLARLLAKTLPVVLRHALTGVLLFTVMFAIEPRLGLLALAVVGTLAWLVRRYAPGLREASRAKRRREGEVAALAQEIVKGLPAIQALGSEAFIRQRFGACSAAGLRAGVQETRVAVAMERTMQLANGLAMAAMIGGGGLLVLRGSLSVGELTVFTAYLVQLLKPVEKINELAATVSRGLARGEQLLAVLELRPAVQEAADARPLARCRGRVTLKGVAFGYPGAGAGALFADLHCALEPGTLTLLTGPSGCGKSSLLRLLLRQFDPTAGGLFLDGTAYPQIRLADLRRCFAVMLQEHHFLAGRLRDALLEPDADGDDAMVWRALERVALETQIRELPRGLDTPLSEEGLNLSGGQRARLSLARALLQARPIVLLDEPLANVDEASRLIITATIDDLRARHTWLVISHQSLPGCRADQWLELAAGRLRQVGLASVGQLQRSPAW